MSTSERSQSLTHLARIGFSRLTEAEAELVELEQLLGLEREALTGPASRSADPDAAVSSLTRIARRDAASVRALHADARGWSALWALLGASTGFADFYLRHPEELAHLTGAGERLPSGDEMRAALLDSVGAEDGFSAEAGDEAWVALRVRYRRLLAAIAAYDLLSAVAGGRAGGRGGSARGCRRRGARGVAVRRAHPGLDRRCGCGSVPARSGRRHAPRGHRHGQDRRARTELRQRRRRDLRRRRRRRGGGRDRREPHRRHRDPPRGADDARHLRRGDRAAAVGGGCQPAAGGQAGRAGAHARLAPVVLRPLGQELGVPGAPEGPPDRRRCRARRRVRARGAAEDLDERGAGELRGQRAAHARARDRAHPVGRCPVPAQARTGRHPRHRVHGAAAPARARALR